VHVNFLYEIKIISNFPFQIHISLLNVGTLSTREYSLIYSNSLNGPENRTFRIKSDEIF
jgi:hypothetical protein